MSTACQIDCLYLKTSWPAYSAEILSIGSVTPKYKRIKEAISKIKDIRFLVVNVIMLNLNKLFIKLLPNQLYIK
jgi:hypothetical protein